MAHARRTTAQIKLPKTSGWGGVRKGAGRPRATRELPHLLRPDHRARFPLHVTLRARRHGLQADAVLEPLIAALTRLRARRQDFRVIEFSLQDNHLHMIVEAHDSDALSHGMQGLASALGRVMNRALGTGGQLWADRYHARELRTPREVRNALVYVLQNSRKHRTGRRGRFQKESRDRYSSARWFDGFRRSLKAADKSFDGDDKSFERGGALELAKKPLRSPLAEGRTWLITAGWRRLGLIGLDEKPRMPPPRIIFWEYLEVDPLKMQR